MWSDAAGAAEKANSEDVDGADSEMATTDPTICIQPQTAKTGRERSLSVPCRNESTANVETVVTKAKRAAAYLWMLLHSQNCRLSANRCAHAGCADAKLVHLHMKTCPAGQDFPCPTRYKGCLQARKLLAHYRRCRNIRSRQIGQAPGAKPQHVCLICSMVARQAKTLLDAGPKTQQGPVVAHKKSNNASKLVVLSSFTVTSNSRKDSSSFMVSPNNDTTKLVPCTPADGSSTKLITSFTLSAGTRTKTTELGDWKMPPPAPRVPQASHSAPASPVGAGAIAMGSSSALSHRDCHQCEGIMAGGGFAKPAPLRRKRSGSMDEAAAARVTFCSSLSHPTLDEARESDPSLVSVELGSSSDSSIGFSSLTVSPSRRARSASCHVLSASPKAPVVESSFDTIPEDLGQTPIGDDLGYHQSQS